MAKRDVTPTRCEGRLSAKESCRCMRASVLCVSMYLHMWPCRQIFICACMCLCTYKLMKHASMHVYVYSCLYIYLCVYSCLNS